MIKYSEFYEKYPAKKALLNKRPFYFRYHKNKNSQNVIVLLPGSVGLGDVGFAQFDELAQAFSVITFDYSEEFSGPRDFAKAAKMILSKIEGKKWLVGESLGGMVAQVIIKEYPESIDGGLVLINTSSLAKTMSLEARRKLDEAREKIRKAKPLLSMATNSMVKKKIRETVEGKKENYSIEVQAKINELAQVVDGQVTKKFAIHMANFALQLEENMTMTKDDFSHLDSKVLLVLSKEDQTFGEENKKSLIGLMENPVVEEEIAGGQMSMVLSQKEICNRIKEFIGEESKVR